MGALIDRVENGEASMAHWKGKDGAQDLGDGFTLLEQVWITGYGALEMDPSLLNTKHKGGVCGVWLGASDVSEAADLIHPAFNTLRCVCFDELLTPDCSTQVSVALTGDLDASVLK
jgi:hypothetical protein